MENEKWYAVVYQLGKRVFAYKHYASSVEAATHSFANLYDQRFYHLLTVVEMLPEEEAEKDDIP